VVVEAFVSVFCIATLTGIVFAKFSRPHARVLFSEPILIETRDGVRTLTFRVANQRGNDVVEASIRVSVLKTQVTSEGNRMRRFHDLKLERDSSPIFLLTWQIFHPITEESPIYGMSRDEMLANDVRFVVSLTGLDGTFAQTIHARHAYWAEDVLEGYRFVDVIENLPGGVTQMDFRRFHDVHPQKLDAGRRARTGS
jgi:inward rectifier potassium channel